MLRTRRDYQTPNPALYEKIQQVYAQYFKPAVPYSHRGFRYENALQYGFTNWQKHVFTSSQVYTADEYAAFCGTHCDHLVIPEPWKSRFFAGLRQAVMDFGNRIEVFDSHVLMTVEKPVQTGEE